MSEKPPRMRPPQSSEEKEHNRARYAEFKPTQEAAEKGLEKFAEQRELHSVRAVREAQAKKAIEREAGKKYLRKKEIEKAGQRTIKRVLNESSKTEVEAYGAKINSQIEALKYQIRKIEGEASRSSQVHDYENRFDAKIFALEEQIHELEQAPRNPESWKEKNALLRSTIEKIESIRTKPPETPAETPAEITPPATEEPLAEITLTPIPEAPREPSAPAEAPKPYPNPPLQPRSADIPPAPPEPRPKTPAEMAEEAMQQAQDAYLGKYQAYAKLNPILRLDKQLDKSQYAYGGIGPMKDARKAFLEAREKYERLAGKKSLLSVEEIERRAREQAKTEKKGQNRTEGITPPTASGENGPFGLGSNPALQRTSGGPRSQARKKSKNRKGWWGSLLGAAAVAWPGAMGDGRVEYHPAPSITERLSIGDTDTDGVLINDADKLIGHFAKQLQQKYAQSPDVVPPPAVQILFKSLGTKPRASLLLGENKASIFNFSFETKRNPQKSTIMYAGDTLELTPDGKIVLERPGRAPYVLIDEAGPHPLNPNEWKMSVPRHAIRARFGGVSVENQAPENPPAGTGSSGAASEHKVTEDEMRRAQAEGLPPGISPYSAEAAGFFTRRDNPQVFAPQPAAPTPPAQTPAQLPAQPPQQPPVQPPAQPQATPEAAPAAAPAPLEAPKPTESAPNSAASGRRYTRPTGIEPILNSHNVDLNHPQVLMVGDRYFARGTSNEDSFQRAMAASRKLFETKAPDTHVYFISEDVDSSGNKVFEMDSVAVPQGGDTPKIESMEKNTSLPSDDDYTPLPASARFLNQ